MRPGPGARWTWTSPEPSMGSEDQDHPTEAVQSACGPQRAAPRIFLAEDDDALRSLLAWVLHEDGCEVLEADDGIKLAAAMHLGNPSGAAPEADLVISDIRMPGATGLQILEALRELDRPIPCILITAFGDPMVHQEAMRLGASAVFDKPFDIEEFRVVVRKILGRAPRTIL